MAATTNSDPLRTLLGSRAGWRISAAAKSGRTVFRAPGVSVFKLDFDRRTVHHSLAVKVVAASRGAGETQCRNEVSAAIGHFSNPTVVPILGVTTDKAGNMVLFSPYAGDSLQDLLASPAFAASSSLQPHTDLATELLVQLVVALLLMESCDEVHADLKPPNIIWDGQQLLLLDLGACSKTGAHARIFTWAYTDDPILGTIDPSTGRLLYYTPDAVELYSRSSADVAAAFKTLLTVLLGGSFPGQLNPNQYVDELGELGQAGLELLMQRWTLCCDDFSAGRLTGVAELDALVVQLQQIAPELLRLMRGMSVVEPANRAKVTELAMDPLIAGRVLQRVAELLRNQASYCQQRQQQEQLMRRLVPDLNQLYVVSSDSTSSHDCSQKLAALRDGLEQSIVARLQRQDHQLRELRQQKQQLARCLAAMRGKADAACEAARLNERDTVKAAEAAKAEAAAAAAQAAVQLEQAIAEKQAAEANATLLHLEKHQLEERCALLELQLREATADRQAANGTGQQSVPQPAAPPQAPSEQQPEQHVELDVAVLDDAAVQTEPPPAVCELQAQPAPPKAIKTQNTNNSSSNISGGVYEPDTPERGSFADVAIVCESVSSTNSSDDSSSPCDATQQEREEEQEEEKEQVVNESVACCRVSRRRLLGLAVASAAAAAVLLVWGGGRVSRRR